MPKGNLTSNEEARVKVLREYEILDSGQDPHFEDLTRLIATLCHTPIALISLIDSNRQWFKSRFGWDATSGDRAKSFCDQAILGTELLIVENALEDPRFANHPHVLGPSHIRFYAGAPLISSNGFALGTLCVLDRKPRHLSPEQATSLQILSRQVVAQMEAKKLVSQLVLRNRELRVTNRTVIQQTHALNESSIIAFTDPAGRITFVNDKFCDISGYSRDELLGKDHRILNSGLHPKSFFVDLWKTISSGKTWSGQIRNRAKQGHIYWVNTTIVPFKNEEGRIEQYIAIRSDITEQKVTEAKLIESAKMSSLGEMAGGIAHEINNPLAIILGKVETIIDRYTSNPNDTEVILSDLTKIQLTVNRIADIVKGLRAFSRSGESLPFRLTSLESIVADTVALCREKFKTHGVEIQISVPRDVSLECRSVQLSQVFLNLLNNSFDAIQLRPEKWIKIEAHQGPQRDIVIHFTDSGPGISSEIRDKLMQPFFTTKELGKGTGLGLSVSRGIIEDHGGTLALDPQCTNTRFSIHLPPPPCEREKKAT